MTTATSKRERQCRVAALVGERLTHTVVAVQQRTEKCAAEPPESGFAPMYRLLPASTANAVVLVRADLTPLMNICRRGGCGRRRAGVGRYREFSPRQPEERQERAAYRNKHDRSRNLPPSAPGTGCRPPRRCRSCCSTPPGCQWK